MKPIHLLLCGLFALTLLPQLSLGYTSNNISFGGPVAICHSGIVVSLDFLGNATITPEIIDARSFDLDGPVTLSISRSSFNCGDVGTPITIELTVTDTDNNTNLCTSLITVEDKVGPTAICYANITIELDNSGNANLTPNMVDGGSNDNCNIISKSIVPSHFDCSDLGSRTVFMTVEDASGNTNLCYSTVEIEDNITPTPICLLTVLLDLNSMGEAILQPSDVDAGSYDNCNISNYRLSKSHFTCEDGGTTQIRMEVIDEGGNSDYCVVNVVIQDSDCDGIADACDKCNGADDSVDNNNDGIPDCSQNMSYSNYSNNWKCNQDKGKERLMICHNEKTKCIKLRNLSNHMNHGDFAGPCTSCSQALKVQNANQKSKSTSIEYNLYPNPTNDRFTLQVFESEEIYNISIFDIQGRVIQNLLTGNDGIINVNFKRLNAHRGLYFIRINKRDIVQNLKVMYIP